MEAPRARLVPPSDFIPVAEEMGLIVQLGEWALRQACAEAMEWPEEICVSVNLSPVQFSKGNLVSTVMNALASSGLPPPVSNSKSQNWFAGEVGTQHRGPQSATRPWRSNIDG